MSKWDKSSYMDENREIECPKCGRRSIVWVEQGKKPTCPMCNKEDSDEDE